MVQEFSCLLKTCLVSECEAVKRETSKYLGRRNKILKQLSLEAALRKEQPEW